MHYIQASVTEVREDDRKNAGALDKARGLINEDEPGKGEYHDKKGGTEEDEEGESDKEESEEEEEVERGEDEENENELGVGNSPSGENGEGESDSNNEENDGKFRFRMAITTTLRYLRDFANPLAQNLHSFTKSFIHQLFKMLITGL